MFPHFGEKFSCLILGVGEVTDHSAILSMRYPESIYRQFGPYRNACAELVCQSAKNALAAVPEKIHHVKRAVITDLQCVAKGDACCEWEFIWEPLERLSLLWRRASDAETMTCQAGPAIGGPQPACPEVIGRGHT